MVLRTRENCILLVIAVTIIWDCGATRNPFIETNSLRDVLKHLFVNDFLSPFNQPSQHRFSRNGFDSNVEEPTAGKTMSTPQERLPTVHVHNNFFLVSNPHQFNVNLEAQSPPLTDRPIKKQPAATDNDHRDRSNGFKEYILANTASRYNGAKSNNPSVPPDGNPHQLGSSTEGRRKVPPNSNMVKSSVNECGTMIDSSPFSNVFIDGKKFGETACALENPNDGESSLAVPTKNLQPMTINANPGNAKHVLHCVPETDPHCKSDSIVFDGGLKIPYQDIRNMFEMISHQPEDIKLIVPGGVSGPLANYFHEVDRSRHEEAAKYGVCVFPNGLLVPIKPMLRILQLHFWLLQFSNDANSRDGNAVHRSINWSNMDCVLRLLRCLVEANIVFVRLPSNEVFPFVEFESNQRHIPRDILKNCNVEILGLSISYLHFKNALLQFQQVPDTKPSEASFQR